jgi:Domain of unknown function (DUF4412)
MKLAPAFALSLVLALPSCHKDSPAAADGGAAAASGGGGSATDPGELSLTDFEGEIDLVAKGKTSPTPVPLSLLVQKEVIRVDVPQDVLSAQDTHGITGGGKVYAILNVPQKKLFVVLDAKKQAVAIDLDQAGQQMKSMHPGGRGGAGATADPPKVVKTGKRETVAGISCADWDVINTDKSKLSACVADKGASFFHLPLTGIPTEHAWALEFMDGKHFPLRGIAYDKDGAESGRVEVTKLDKRTLDASQFVVPAGYQTVSLEDMISGMMAGGMPGAPGAPLDIPPGMNNSGGHEKPRHHKGRKPPQN